MRRIAVSMSLARHSLLGVRRNLEYAGVEHEDAGFER